jgi:hypothetical protein
MLEFVAILIGLTLLWQLRRTDFGKAMFVLLGLCALSLAIVTSAEIIKTTWKQPAFDPDEYLRNTRTFDATQQPYEVVPDPCPPAGKVVLPSHRNRGCGLPPGFQIDQARSR